MDPFLLFPCYEEKTFEMIHCEAIPFNAFQVNTYLIWEDSGQALVVDPAFYEPEEQALFESTLRDKGLSLSGQINTHCHVDHILGVQYIRNTYGHPFRAHPQENILVEKAALMGELYGWKVDDLGGIDEELEDREVLKLGAHEIHCLLVPGHSPGSLALHVPDGNFVITGDALFANSIGRTDLPGGDYDTLMASIRDRLLVLPDDTAIYPGHGPSSTIGFERSDNPFLQGL